MRVFTIINGYTGALCLQELIDQGHEVVGVVTAPNFQPDVPPEQTVIGVATKNLLPLNARRDSCHHRQGSLSANWQRRNVNPY